MQKIVMTILFLGLGASAAGAFGLSDLEPCRPAATKLCDRSGGINMSNLLRCGATLAANHWRVGRTCREVLKRYGQL
jgi:hypothetical protein